MASQSSEDIPPNPGVAEVQQDVAGEPPKRSSDPSVLVNSEPFRDDQVQNAVKFLSHPKVRGSPVMYRRSLLEKKGLKKEEIDEAFRLVPDLVSRKTIGLGEQRDGLYYFAELATDKSLHHSSLNRPSCNFTISPTDLWHSRLVKTFSAPASVEPSTAPHSKSYMEDIDDSPPILISRHQRYPSPTEIHEEEEQL